MSIAITSTKSKLECVHAAMDWIDSVGCLGVVQFIGTNRDKITVHLESGVAFCSIFVFDSKPKSDNQYGKMWEMEFDDFRVVAVEGPENATR